MTEGGGGRARGSRRNEFNAACFAVHAPHGIAEIAALNNRWPGHRSTDLFHRKHPAYLTLVLLLMRLMVFAAYDIGGDWISILNSPLSRGDGRSGVLQKLDRFVVIRTRREVVTFLIIKKVTTSEDSGGARWVLVASSRFWMARRTRVAASMGWMVWE
jgi:hypothetical protein